ncbi:hypothetical protein J6590_042041 [Homalodisca vitripennis]|nr:hypothetical protein J6590_042041 [Homalodisca vitripennis]
MQCNCLLSVLLLYVSVLTEPPPDLLADLRFAPCPFCPGGSSVKDGRSLVKDGRGLVKDGRGLVKDGRGLVR